MACPRCTFINDVAVDQRHRCKMCGSTFSAEIDGCRSSEGAAGEGKDWAEEERAIEESDRTIAPPFFLAKMACPRCAFISDVAVDKRHRCKMCGSTFSAEIDGCRSSEGAAGEGKDWAEEERAIEASDRTIAWILGGGGRQETDNFSGDSREGNVHRLVASLGFPVAEKPSFRLAYSAPALRFWVEQVGRSCGAVSVANALNALCGSPVADQQSVMRIFECQLERRIASLKRGLAQKLEARHSASAEDFQLLKRTKNTRWEAFFWEHRRKTRRHLGSPGNVPCWAKLKVRSF